MTDKVQKIREKVERKLDVMRYQVHRKDAYKELKSILDYIDSLQEESVSKDLEEFALQYAGHHAPYDSCMQEMEDAVKAGAKWQKEHLWKSADGEI